MGKHNSHAALAPLLILAMSLPLAAFGWDRTFGRWTAASSPIYPVVRVYFCRETFANIFTSYPADGVFRQALAAANEWFVGGNSNIRLRYAGDLPASSLECQGAGHQVAGRIVVSAEVMSGVAPCDDLARAFNVGIDPIQGSYVVLFRNRRDRLKSGCPTTGSGTPTPWASNANFPAPGYFDFRAVLAHELGHAIGFSHSAACFGAADQRPVMCAGQSTGVSRAHLAADDRDGLRSDATYGYGGITTSLVHRHSYTNGVTWLNEGEPFFAYTMGSPSICYRASPPTGLLRYFVAYSDTFFNRTVTFTTEGPPGPEGRVDHWAFYSYMSPAVACAPDRYLLAVAGIDPRSINVKTSTDGVNWTASTNTGLITVVAPSAAWSALTGRFVITWIEPGSEAVRFATSLDGVGWQTTAAFADLKGSTLSGIACSPTMNLCTLVVADSRLNDSPTRQIEFTIDGFGVVSRTADATTWWSSYGGSVAHTGDRWAFVWRDRGTGTPLTSAWWWAPPTLNDVTFADVAHAPPSLAYGTIWGEWSAWFTYSGAYNAL